MAFAYPRGLYYPRYAREVKSDPSGAKATLKKGFPEKTEFSLWISILDDGKQHFPTLETFLNTIMGPRSEHEARLRAHFDFKVACFSNQHVTFLFFYEMKHFVKF